MTSLCVPARPPCPSVCLTRLSPYGCSFERVMNALKLRPYMHPARMDRFPQQCCRHVFGLMAPLDGHFCRGPMGTSGNHQSNSDLLSASPLSPSPSLFLLSPSGTHSTSLVLSRSRSLSLALALSRSLALSLLSSLPAVPPPTPHYFQHGTMHGKFVIVLFTGAPLSPLEPASSPHLLQGRVFSPGEWVMPPTHAHAATGHRRALILDQMQRREIYWLVKVALCSCNKGL